MTMKKLILFLSLMAACSTPLEALDVSVMAKVPSRDNEAFLKENIVGVFTLKSRTWSTGERLQVFILPKDSIYTKVFTQKYLHMSPQRYYDILEANQASGRGVIPVIVESQSDLVLKVLNTRGSIGYADASVLVNLGNRVYIVN